MDMVGWEDGERKNFQFGGLEGRESIDWLIEREL
jgi:hypothetical protein